MLVYVVLFAPSRDGIFFLLLDRCKLKLRGFLSSPLIDSVLPQEIPFSDLDLCDTS